MVLGSLMGRRGNQVGTEGDRVQEGRVARMTLPMPW